MQTTYLNLLIRDSHADTVGMVQGVREQL